MTMILPQQHHKKQNDVKTMMNELETEYTQRLEEERIARRLAEADIRDVKSTLEEQMKYSKRMEIEIEKLEQKIAIERTEKILLGRGAIPSTLLKDPKLTIEEESPTADDNDEVITANIRQRKTEQLADFSNRPTLQRAISVKDRKNFFEEIIAEKTPAPLPTLKRVMSISDTTKAKITLKTDSLLPPMPIINNGRESPKKLESPRKSPRKLKVSFSRNSIKNDE